MLKFIKNYSLPNWLIITLVLMFILRIPSFFEPFAYGDELIYLNLGLAIRRGLVLYKDIYDNKPPLLYFTAALAGNIFWFKTILAFWSTFTIIIFWELAKVLFKNKISAIQISVIIFALLTTLPLFEGNIANAENFILGFSLLAFLILKI